MLPHSPLGRDHTSILYACTRDIRPTNLPIVLLPTTRLKPLMLHLPRPFASVHAKLGGSLPLADAPQLHKAHEQN